MSDNKAAYYGVQEGFTDMRHYPAFMDIIGRKALVIGQGESADRKAQALRRAGAEVNISPTFKPGLLDGCTIAIGAEATDEDLQALSRTAIERGIPVNIVDRPELCSFITPAIVDRSPLTIAISSGGAAPVLARLLRAKIEALVSPSYARLAALAEQFKDRLRAAFPDMAIRRRALESLLTGPAADLALNGQENEAGKLFEAAISQPDTISRKGIVYLVGAGPGAPDLLTLRAQRLLGEADVIVHDRLVTDEILDMGRRDASRIFVGKARANHCMRQEDINALLVRLGQEGKRVVRLKGGDPLIFGRGGEEAEALAEAGVAFEIVPGITAALGCAAGSNIPLTHREAARAVTFITGHTRDGTLEMDFHGAVQLGGTLAVYMGIVTLPRLRDGLLAAGLPAETPAALIERGGTKAQRALFGTLDYLVETAPDWSEGGPALVLVGKAVGRTVPAHQG
ncbi:siroheme synthase CysG [Granulibacter bethesdensis]|uniref:siroheme synthase CysG n=1 Tax=Granulibacter bethesdensis TaxID=364410 RepID=UPI0020A528D6|nr:siroheme synthase CysG [Granulibacter bethesdensis]